MAAWPGRALRELSPSLSPSRRTLRGRCPVTQASTLNRQGAGPRMTSRKVQKGGGDGMGPRPGGSESSESHSRGFFPRKKKEKKEEERQ